MEDVDVIYLVTWFIKNQSLTDVWYYGRVFNTSTGIHAEYHTPDEKILSLLYLGPNEDQALQMIKMITQQHIYIYVTSEMSLHLSASACSSSSSGFCSGLNKQLQPCSKIAKIPSPLNLRIDFDPSSLHFAISSSSSSSNFTSSSGLGVALHSS